MQLTVKEICEKIWFLEDKYELLYKDIQGVKVWQQLRMNIYYDIVQKTGLFGQPQAKPDTVFDRVKAFPSMLRSCLMENPFYGNNKPSNMIFDHARKKKINNKYIDIYTNYLIESLNSDDVLILEQPYLNKHVTIKEKNRKHTDYLQVMSLLLSKLLPVKFNSQETATICNLENEISLLFGVRLNLHRKFLIAIKKYKIRYKLYDGLFKKVKPRKVYIVVAYGQGALVAAAKHNRIPVIEIQHGTISPYHLGYSFPKCDRELEYFPDYFYSFGEYWANSVQLPIGKDRIISYGFPYFQEMKSEYNNLYKEPKQILFLSQGVIGRELSKLAYQAALELKEYKIIYKLHPAEYDRWQDDYYELHLAKELSNFSLIDNDSTNLYKYLAESQYQVGVFSTALYEGIAFCCKTILVDLPGLEYMQDLIDGEFAQKISDVSQLSQVLKEDKFKQFDINHFFFDRKNYL